MFSSLDLFWVWFDGDYIFLVMRNRTKDSRVFLEGLSGRLGSASFQACSTILAACFLAYSTEPNLLRISRAREMSFSSRV